MRTPGPHPESRSIDLGQRLSRLIRGSCAWRPASAAHTSLASARCVSALIEAVLSLFSTKRVGSLLEWRKCYHVRKHFKKQEAVLLALVRKLRRVGNSLSVIVPADFVKAMGLAEGDAIEFLVTGRDEFRIRRAQTLAIGASAADEPR